jgi:hypothetical protein
MTVPPENLTPWTKLPTEMPLLLRACSGSILRSGLSSKSLCGALGRTSIYR